MVEKWINTGPFKSTLDLIEMVLAKALTDISARYDDLLVPDDLKPLGIE